ncbi:DNA circularization protein, partial [Desulfovibrio porci]|uniref:DNA circularization protein n=1 Tax=Desulfovibrio porci TaxID=2605782 RepID=UPI003A953331
YPYRAGGEVEDLGRKPRIIPLKAVFWGVNYLSGLRALVKAFEKEGKGELIHPVFGSVEVVIRNWDIPHEAERPNYATVSFEAVEASPDNPFFDDQSTRSLAERASDALLGGLAQALNDSAASLQATLGEVAGQAASLQNSVLAELDGLLMVYDSARTVTRTAMSYLDFPSAFVADLSACIQSAASGVGGLSGFASLGGLSGLLPRLDVSTGQSAGTYPSGANSYGPAWVSGPVSDNVGRAEAVLAIRQESAAPAATPAPEPKSAQTPIGQAATHAMLAQTQVYAQAARDMLMAELSTPTLTPAEVESLTGNTRDRLQDCLHAVRASQPQAVVHQISECLRDAAQAVQQLGEAALNARPPLVMRTVERPCNFHLLAHRLYGDYTRATELARINPQVRNPNFIAQGQEVLVYAR